MTANNGVASIPTKDDESINPLSKSDAIVGDKK
jgi:hypothetical protein